MTDTIGSVPARIDQQQLAQQLVDSAREDGVELVGPGGLLTGLTKTSRPRARPSSTSTWATRNTRSLAATAATRAMGPGPRRCSLREAGADRGAP